MKTAEVGKGQICFDFIYKMEEEEEKQFRERCKTLPYYSEPKTDNEQLFNYQYNYYNNGGQDLDKMYLLYVEIAKKLIRKECHEHKIRFTQNAIWEKAVDSAVLIIEQIQKNRLVITTSFVAYLYLQVRKVMYGQTEGQEFECYCLRNGINFFTLDDKEKQTIKEGFLKWRKLKKRKKRSKVFCFM